jgi:formate dehydrogenase major subunit
VIGLITAFGASGGTSSYAEVENTDVIVLWGSNAREAHPIFFHHVLKALHRGARLYVVDPRRTPTARFADRWLGLNVGTDIALAHAVGTPKGPGADPGPSSSCRRIVSTERRPQSLARRTL